MAFKPFNILKYITIGFLAGILTLVVSWVITIFKIPAYLYNNEWFSFSASTIEVNLREQISNQGFFGKLGETFVSLLAWAGFDFNTIVYVIVGTIIVVLGGRVLIGFANTKPEGRIFLSFLTGGAILGLFLLPLAGLPFITGLLSALLFSVVLGLLMQLIVQIKQLKWLGE